MSIFAKLFNIGTDQILYRKNFTKGETPHKISYESEINGITIEAELGYKNEGERNIIFDRIDHETAVKNLGALKNIIH